jgi:hypothetical protein
MTWTEAAELVGCPVPTIDWWTRLGRIEKRPFHGNRPSLKRASVEEFAAWYAEREARKQRKREQLAARSRARFKPPTPDGWMSTSDAAAVLGVKTREIYWLVEHAYLRATRTPTRLWIEASSVEQRRAQQQSDREDWVSRAEAARIAGCGTETIQKAIRNGTIVRRPGPRRQPSLLRSSVEAFARMRSSSGVSH